MVTNNHPDGIVTISDRAVMQIASFAAEKSNGVAEMTERTKKDEAARLVSGRSDTAGAYIRKTSSGVVIDVYVACKYGADVNCLKSEVSENVKDAYIGTGITIREVNVHINSVK